MMPAFTSSSLYLPMSASIFSLGITFASEFFVAFTITITRIVFASCSPVFNQLLYTSRTNRRRIDIDVHRAGSSRRGEMDRDRLDAARVAL
jgi:hypothetical protein